MKFKTFHIFLFLIFSFLSLKNAHKKNNTLDEIELDSKKINEITENNENLNLQSQEKSPKLNSKNSEEKSKNEEKKQNDLNSFIQPEILNNLNENGKEMRQNEVKKSDENFENPNTNENPSNNDNLIQEFNKDSLLEDGNSLGIKKKLVIQKF